MVRMTNNYRRKNAAYTVAKPKLVFVVSGHGRTQFVTSANVVHGLANGFVDFIANYPMVPMRAHQLRYSRALQLHNMKCSISAYQGNIVLVEWNKIMSRDTDIATAEYPVALSNESLNFCLINGG